MPDQPLPAGRRTFDPGDHPAYGTGPDEYVFWFDYPYRWWGASLERPTRRYLVSIGAALCTLLTGALIAGISGGVSLALTAPAGITPAGLASIVSLYTSQPAVYLICGYVGYVLHVFRWQSQTYHARVNRIRACFTVDDEEYAKLVSGLAARAADGGRTVRWVGAAYAIIFAYFLAVTYLPGPVRAGLDPIYPRFVPRTWRFEYSGALLAVILFFALLVVLMSYTAINLSRALVRFCTEVRRFAEEHATEIQPLPSLIEDRFDGILDLSLLGVLQFALGIAFLEILYLSRLDVTGGVFVAVAIAQGLSLFIAPRASVQRIVHRARNHLLVALITRDAPSSTAPSPSPDGARELLALAMLEHADLLTRSEVLRAEVATRSQTVSILGILGFILTQVPSVLVPIAIAVGIERVLRFIPPFSFFVP